jgi:hypothetical protein
MEEKFRKEKEEKEANVRDGKEEESSGPKYEDNEIDEAHYGTVEEEIITQQQISEEPQAAQLIESTTKQEIIETTEAPPQPLTTIVYEHEHEQQLQSIETEVEIKNVGVSGHLTHHVEIS